MEVKVQVLFQQLLTIVKRLTHVQKEKLRQVLAEDKQPQEDKDEFIKYLLNGPVYSDKEIQRIEENRKRISAWRTKS